ncbi:probable peroxisomal membrane protein PEX13 [Manduca sexta]|uniref:probable peroxisomal membrane protein PEX13 n=1 Tax=Manduca sexta TaxID=7130 RepID=UPI0011833AB5|nr:probable peroxisomal membrane protein PEX13 [Manduca sexta]
MNEPNPFEGQGMPQMANMGAMPNVADLQYRNLGGDNSGNMPPMAPQPPPLPPRLDQQNNFGMNQGMGYGMGFNGMGGYGGYGFNNLGGGYGMGGVGIGGMAPYVPYNRFGPNGMFMGDMESRFVQIAEERSRPAFDSIHGVVSAVGSVAMMLENTFFALTSSFRAILGVAENVGRLRSLFGQFWSTFAVFRSINWLVRKLLVMLGLRNECEFKAWAEAMAASPNNLGPHQQLPNGTSWPILLFFGVIAAAPYIVHKMLTGLTNTINEKLHEPATWQSPLRAIAEFDFEATHGHELSFNANQVLHLAPQHLQGNMWNSGWLVASIDMIKAGVIPANYIKIIKPVSVNKTAPKDNAGAAAPSQADMHRYFAHMQ